MEAHTPTEIDRPKHMAPGTSSSQGGWVRRVVAAAGSVRQLASRPRVRPWLFAATALVFVALAVTSFRSLPDEGRSAKPALVAVLVLVTAPATLALNALEYRFMASRLGHRIDFRHAMRVSLIASIANYLPAPGVWPYARRRSSARAARSARRCRSTPWPGWSGSGRRG